MLSKEDVLNLIKNVFSNEYVVQNASELEFLISRVSFLEPTAILEVGVEKGGTLKVWEQLLQQSKDSILIGIDINPDVKWNIDKSIVSVFIIKGNSHDISTIDKVLKILNDRNIKSLDFAYIDGEHSNESVKKDFELYSKLVRHDGLIGFHDTRDIKEFLESLPQGRLEILCEQSHYKDIGLQPPIGTGVYYVN